MVSFLVLLCIAFLSLCGCITEYIYPPDSYFTENITVEETAVAVSKYVDVLDKRANRVRKTQFKSQNRVLFIAGLEGTGHHAWEYAIYFCTSRKICIVEKEMTEAMMHIEPSKWMLYGLFGNEGAHGDAKHLAFIYNRMRAIGEGRAGECALRIIGIGLVRSSGMLSYPNYDVQNKALARPDIITMAAIAESAQVDFRVLVLQREPASIMASVERRMFGHGLEPQVLLANAESLYFQVRTLDPLFYRCFRYESYGNLSARASETLQTFMSPLIDKLWKDMLLHLHISKTTSNSSTVVDVGTSDTDDKAVTNNAQRLGNTIAELNRVYNVKLLEARTRRIDALCDVRALE